MPGPIHRLYGFPNYDKIFGKQDLQHGADEPEGPASDRLGASDLTPDLPDDAGPLDPNAPEAAGKIAPSTEFGQSGG
jgi:hypothetical protein